MIICASGDLLHQGVCCLVRFSYSGFMSCQHKQFVVEAFRAEWPGPLWVGPPTNAAWHPFWMLFSRRRYGSHDSTSLTLFPSCSHWLKARPRILEVVMRGQKDAIRVTCQPTTSPWLVPPAISIQMQQLRISRLQYQIKVSPYPRMHILVSFAHSHI